MSSPQELLASLTQTLQQFLLPSTDTAEKRRIEETLTAFKQNPQSWQQCFHFFSSTRDEHVLWFSATVFEEVVGTRWASLTAGEQEQLKSFLLQFLHNCMSFPRMVSTKISTVLVSIAIADWPTRYPGFYNDVTGLMAVSPALGLSMVKLLLEELGSSRCRLTFARKVRA
jgi:hypothetical protein